MESAQKVNSGADQIWQAAKEIKPDMPDIAQELKEIVSRLHALAGQIRKRSAPEEDNGHAHVCGACKMAFICHEKICHSQIVYMYCANCDPLRGEKKS